MAEDTFVFGMAAGGTVFADSLVEGPLPVRGGPGGFSVEGFGKEFVGALVLLEVGHGLVDVEATVLDQKGRDDRGVDSREPGDGLLYVVKFRSELVESFDGSKGWKSRRDGRVEFTCFVPGKRFFVRRVLFFFVGRAVRARHCHLAGFGTFGPVGRCDERVICSLG